MYKKGDQKKLQKRSLFMIAHTIMNVKKCALKLAGKVANPLKCFQFYKVTKVYKKELKQMTYNRSIERRKY